jgi:hypothetical protein
MGKGKAQALEGEMDDVKKVSLVSQLTMTGVTLLLQCDPLLQPGI